MFDEPRINLILLVLNMFALANFIYPPRKQFLIIITSLMIVPIPYPVKLKMRIVTLLSLIASFTVDQILSELCCVIALGLAINTSYQLELTEGPAMINTALGLSQISSYWSHQYLQKNSIDRDITLMIFSLPNLFLCVECQISRSKVLYLINPLLDDNWLYSVGFVLGIYTTSLTSIQKHYKFFCISTILLIQANLTTQTYFLSGILALVRGLMVYTQHTHNSEMYFLLLFLCVKVLFSQYLFYFMFIGYLVIGVILFQQAKLKREIVNVTIDESVGTQQLFNDMYELRQIKTK